ncbi:proline-rich membrane anchor 1 isoform X2 [Takifugu rubripes]|uniref:proline-rich membrane anchor 1 isoform X2 n=1 Tax=Takifugu rubripes TaxID=31033 RepID=UPI001145C5C9|nr:proline-rich membrane anchor 1 isoform X2 [Takifugu rubripes]
MRSTTGIQEENDCGINYFWRRLSQIPPRSRTGWMGELQRSCSRAVAEKVSEQCQLACHCRRYPPLPPPPPPPPPPRLLSTTVAEPMVPLVQPWWMDFLVLGTVGCASVVFLLSAIIICYKAIKRKPLRKEENGTSRREYAMSIRNKKAMGTNNTVV